jgi:hypothetical protein
MKTHPIPLSIPNLEWAAKRAGLPESKLVKKFPRWKSWLSGDDQPTLKQLRKFSEMTYVPSAYFLCKQRPDLSMPIADFRTINNDEPREPSIALLKTIYICQSRQAWYSDYITLEGAEDLDFVGSASTKDNVVHVALNMHERFGFSSFANEKINNPYIGLKKLISLADEIGILVMSSPVFGFNNKLKLDIKEFRGFL